MEEYQLLQQIHNSRDLFPIQHRICLLRQLKMAVNKNVMIIKKALFNDLGKSFPQSNYSEIICVQHEIDYFIKNLNKLSQKRVQNKTLLTLNADMYLLPQPAGPTLIITPFNYPFQLSMIPLIGALAAGNPVLLKISRQSPNVQNAVIQILKDAQLYEQYVYLYNKNDYDMLPAPYAVVFFTGSTKIGKQIYQQAAQSLSKCILELGGANPLLITDTLNTSQLNSAVQQIVFGKFLNAGQTCIAPNYICHVSKSDQKFQNFIKLLKQQILLKYSSDNHQHLCKIINQAKYKGLQDLVINSKIFFSLINNQFVSDKQQLLKYLNQQSDLKFPPTLIVSDQTEQFLTNEIFGPVLPVFRLETTQEFNDFYKKHYHALKKPLSFYLFSGKKNEISQIVNQYRGGAISVNQCLFYQQVVLPFGGVGESGLGRYHGKYSFEEFSFHQPVLIQKNNIVGRAIQQVFMRIVTPPFIQLPNFLVKLTYIQFNFIEILVVSILLSFLVFSIMRII